MTSSSHRNTVLKGEHLSFSVTVSVLSTLLTVGSPSLAQPPPEYCPKNSDQLKAAIEETAQAMDAGRSVASRSREEALCQGVCCLSEEDQDFEVHVNFFVTPEYDAFAFLGWLHYEQKDHNAALRYFNLSRCLSKEREEIRPGRFPSFLEPKQLDAEARRPRKHPEFEAGCIAHDDGEWQKAAQKLQKAIENWDDDGGSARIQGRFFSYYLPRYYLASALYELGCVRQAVHLVQCSRLSQCQLRGEDRRRAHRILAHSRVAGSIEELSSCREWEWIEAQIPCACAGCLGR